MSGQNREIGSEYWDIPICEKENDLFANMQWFLSGRSALSFIIKDIKQNHTVKTAALPYWCCDSMILPFSREGIEVSFYDDEIPDCDIILTMEYFGYIRKENAQFQGVVIYDVTHSLFSPDMGVNRVIGAKEEYLFGSLRKWAGFKTGGFADKLGGEFSLELPEKTNEEYTALRTKAMKEKAEYLQGGRENKDYLNIFSKAEDMLEDIDVYAACNSDMESAKKLDVDFIRNRRRENAKILLNEVSDIAIFKEIKEEDVPLFVPIVLPEDERDNLRKYLIANSVFCPIHWPHTEWHGEKKEIYSKELSLVCDQRYTIKDMEYICELIRKFRR